MPPRRPAFMPERLLVVGLGSVGTRHLRVARELLPQAQFAVLRHRSHQDVSHTGLHRCFTSLDEALKFRPDAAVIANPSTLHLDVAMPLADAGVHLLVEKPLAAASAGIPELVAMCRARSVTLMIGYNLRFMPSLRRFRELVLDNRGGRVLSVRAEIGQYLPSWRPDFDYRQTVSAKAALGGGVLLELSHDIDYLRWIFGEVEWVSAVVRKQSSLDIDVEDTAHLTLGFIPKQNATPAVATLNMDMVRHDSTRSCVVIGERASIRWDALAGTVEIFEKGAASWATLFRDPGSRDGSYVAEWRHFLDCIAYRAAPAVTGADGLQALRIVEAARSSAETKRIVMIERDCMDGNV